MPQMRRFISLIWFLLLYATAFGESRTECSLLSSQILRRPVRYCVLLPDNFNATIREHPGQRYPVLYFLHGLGNNEQTLFTSGGWNIIQDLRQQHKIGDFLLVAPEGRRSFFINSADGKTRYSDFFLQELMPYIERKYPVRAERRSRGISGLSMGGYGALRFAFARPDLFGSVSAESAALMPESPKDLNAAIHAPTPLGNLLGPVFGVPIDQAHWNANSPLVLARKSRTRLKSLPIYFNCGQSDDLGFERGAALLHRQLQTKGIAHEFHLYPGDHSLEYFLAHFGEVMEFHWKVFSGAK
jgi:S-formylglutathione hydrolase FrmB